MLKFKLSDLQPIVAHAKASPEHKMVYDNPATNKPGLFLVKDSGVYLMSNGKPHLHDPARPQEPDASLVCYATGHDPRIADTYDADRDECGGDDFSEFIELPDVDNAIAQGYKTLAIKLTAKTINIYFWKR